MNDIDHDLREMFRRREADLMGPVSAPPRIASRIRRQQGVTLLAVALTTAAVIAGIVSGLSFIERADPTVPAVPMVPTHRNGEIAVRAGVGGGRDAIIQIDPATGREVPLPIAGSTLRGWPYGPQTDLAWSPGGSALAYVRHGVWVLDVSSGDSQKVSSCGPGARSCTVAWSPDGSAIAVAHDDEIELMTTDGGNRTTLSSLGPGFSVRDPTWSPDGGRIAFVSSDGASDDLYVTDLSGSDPQVLVDLAPGNPSGVVSPAWSPDGSQIAYLSAEGEEPAWLLSVTVVETDGSIPTEIVQVGRCYCLGFLPGLAWSPDGTRMALVIPAPGTGGGSANDGLYVMDADGTDLRLVRERAWGRPAWRPLP